MKKTWVSGWVATVNEIEKSRNKEKGRIKMKKNYMVFYTKRCTPHIKEFTSLAKAQKFCGTVKVDNTDTWIDFIIEGKIVDEFPGSEGIVRQ